MATILVVDDNEDMVEMLAQFFQMKGHRVLTALDAEQGLQKVREEKPSLILMDIMMPRVHGVEALRQVKAIDPGIKVIMITAVDDKDIAEEAMASGATDFITKPLDLQYLDTMVTFNLFE
jgi:DNA-binding NtrC family response regulator